MGPFYPAAPKPRFAGLLPDGSGSPSAPLRPRIRLLHVRRHAMLGLRSHNHGFRMHPDRSIRRGSEMPANGAATAQLPDFKDPSRKPENLYPITAAHLDSAIMELLLRAGSEVGTAGQDPGTGVFRSVAMMVRL